jgi:UDP-glucuronate 4-epimerase
VSDTVSGILAAVDAALGYEIINLGRGEPALVSEFLGAFERITSRKVPWVEARKPEADVERTHADIEKARRLLGYAPRVGLDEGARRMIEWYERAVAKLSP